MTDAAVKRLLRARASSTTGIHTATTKYQAMSKSPTLELCQKTLKSMLAKAEKQCDTQRNNYESLLETLKIDGDDLTSAQVSLFDEHTDAFQTAMEELEELTDGLSKLSMRSLAYAELDSIHTMTFMIDIQQDCSPRKAKQEIATQKLDLKGALKEYATAIRTDQDLKELVAKIGALLNTLSSQVPDEEPPSTPTRDHDATEGKDRDNPPHHQRKLPTIAIPTFNGDILEWEDFWSIFQRTVHNNRDLVDDEKRVYLQQAIKDKSQSNLVDSLSGSYSDCVASLKAKYDQPRQLHQHHTKAFFACKPCKDETRQELTRLHTTLAHARTRLRDTKHHTGDDYMESFAEGLLPPNVWKEWTKQERDQHSIPKMTDLLAFIEFQATLAQCDPIERAKPRREREPQPEQNRHDKRPSYERRVKQEDRSPRRVYTSTPGSSCSLCKDESHPLFYCPQFKLLSVEARGDYVRAQKLCYNCLSHGHNTQACHSSYKCKRCGKNHHTTLHKEQQPQEQRPVSTVVVTGPVRTTPVIHPTVKLIAHGPGGLQLSVRAMLDSGSSVCLVKSKVARQLDLQRHRTSIQIVGVSDTPAGRTDALVKMVLTSEQMPDARLEVSAYTLTKLAGIMPDKALTQPWEFLKPLTLADPDFRLPKDIDLILGEDVMDDIMREGLRVGKQDFPRATKTIFGWTVSGRTKDREIPDDIPQTTRCYRAVIQPTPTEQLIEAQAEGNELLRQFWKTEAVPEQETVLTPDETIAVTHFESTHKVTTTGRFQVTLPRKDDAPQLGSSRPQAVRRFLSNEKALLRKKMWAPFQAVVQEYLTLGHAEKVPTKELLSPCTDHYYLPMHAVTKASPTSTKLRVVFDASAATSTGISLNETLLVGPTIYPPLTEILMRFRTYPVALTADISKMYRAIELADKERDYHRFVWREQTNAPLTDYRMTRVTFGVSASPFLATKALQQAAHSNSARYPQASATVLSSFYVDDCIAGADSVKEAISLQKQLQLMLTPYDLILRKWRSSSRDVMTTIPPDLHETQVDPDDIGNKQYLKTLGIHWDDQDDNFFVSISELHLPTLVTKRLLTSDIARTFDVLGWFTPVTLVMKVLIQRLWENKVDWDGVVPPPIQDEWSEWRSTLPDLARRPLRRSYFRADARPVSLQLHGFADASIKAYAAAIYIRAEYESGPPTIELVTAKSRVAPLKPFTVPRLELCGAQLLARLMTTVRKALDIPLKDVHGWTDSTIVLNWLDGSPRRYKTYVANHIADTLDHMPSTHRKHVPTHQNPADCASRGATPTELMDHHLWWTGPPWLGTSPITMPPQPTLSCEPTEMKATVNVSSTTEPWLVLKYSSFQRVRRVVAWIARFLHNTQLEPADRIESKSLSIFELEEADAVLQRHSQERAFNSHQPRKWKTDQKLVPLNPFKDDKGRLRVGGRLGNADLPYNQIHPIILQGNDRLSTLIIRHHHHSIGHAGPQLLMAHLSREYHVLQGMRAVKNICQKCTTCRRHKVRTEVQLMGQLPPHRVNPGRPFSIVGTDFAGPILTKYGYVRKPTLIKTYVCVFVCMSTKAVHLEAVSDLTTDAFLACLTRFIGRRGKPTAIHSDNGSNFIGAANELERMFQFMREDATQHAVTDFCTLSRIAWHFSPERAPHHGGIWEAAVKSMKFHLRRLTDGHRLTYEELATVLIQIESMLNSRPLVPLHSHSEEGLDVLTPGHFLIGAPLAAMPETRAPTSKSLLKRWNLQRRITEEFWTRWSTEYLRILQRRTKWTKTKPNIRVGDIVLVREDGMFSHTWPLARVIQTFPGKDGLVRAVMLKTSKTTLRRPITKVSVLVSPSDYEESQDSLNRIYRQSSRPGCLGSPVQTV